jgi:hypothetical protein
MTAKIVRFRNHDIRLAEQRVNLTDMWRAAGADPARKPAKWRTQEDAKALFAAISEVPGKDFVISSTKGGTGAGGETWACEEVAIDYGMYLSPDFKVWCLTELRKALRGESDAREFGEGGALLRMLLLPPGIWSLTRESMFDADYVRALNRVYGLFPNWKPSDGPPAYLGRVQQWFYPIVVGSQVYREMVRRREEAEKQKQPGKKLWRAIKEGAEQDAFRECLKMIRLIADTSSDREDFKNRVCAKFEGAMLQVSLMRQLGP